MTKIFKKAVELEALTFLPKRTLVRGVTSYWLFITFYPYLVTFYFSLHLRLTRYCLIRCSSLFSRYF